MRKTFSLGRKLVVGACAFSILGVVGCHKKQDVQTEASKLEQAFAPVGTPPQSDILRTQVNAALAALKANDPAAALAALDTLRKQRLTAEQRMAVNDAAGQVEVALIRRAAAGDQKAKAALDRLQQEAYPR